MTRDPFPLFQRFLRSQAGFNLQAEKRYLLDTRLGRLMRERKIASLGDLAAEIERHPRGDLACEVIEAMMTNETYFFRDRAPFELLRRSLLPELIHARAATKRLSIWCAAASTGQEPYSIAMMLDEFKDRLTGWRIDILATDIAKSAIERARAGIYTQFEVQRGLPIRQLLAHFEKVGESSWRISERIRSMVQFKTFNLMQDCSMLGRFDLILCRNVMIYFDQPTRQAVLSRMQRQLAADGALVLGAAETIIGLNTHLQTNRDTPGIYRMNGAPSEFASVA